MSTSYCHIAWPSIELLHNCVRTLRYLAEQGHPLPEVEYRAKIKLHGTNCGVQITPTGLVAQSRTQLLSPTDDYKGFATWVHGRREYFSCLPHGYTVFGEWCGPGIEKGVAIAQASAKRFAVFAVQAPNGLVYEPTALSGLLGNLPAEMHVLPWEPDSAVAIDFASATSLDAAALLINSLVEKVELEDPWVKRTLGVSGVGEGLVFYPITIAGRGAELNAENLSTWVFKAKGEKHRTAGTKSAVQVEASTVESVRDFVELMVTEARLGQGLTAVCNGTREPRLTAAFLTWVMDDVKKESVAELEASKLTWLQVEKSVQAAAREWYRRPS